MPPLEDKELKRREYFRDKQREHRLRVRREAAAIKAEFAELQARARELRVDSHPAVDTDGGLSWSTLASVFRAESNRSTAKQQALIKKSNAMKDLVAFMQRFVSVNVTAPLPPASPWQSATLLEDPEARKLGKEWLTQQLYYNMDYTFRFFPSVALDEEFYCIDMDTSDDWLNSVEIMQHIWPGNMETSKAYLQNHMAELLFREPSQVLVECTENTKLYRRTTEEGSFINILQGNFVEADRFVVVMRQVEDDEAFNSRSYRQQHIMIWVEVRQVTATHVAVRTISHFSRYFRDGQGFVSVDELAKIWKIDLTGVPEDQKTDHLRSTYIRQERADHSIFRKKIQSIIEKVNSPDYSLSPS